MSMTSPAILSNFFEKQWTQNHPQYLSGLSRALYPTTFLEIAVYVRSQLFDRQLMFLLERAGLYRPAGGVYKTKT